jgi:hypothetical protein
MYEPILFEARDLREYQDVARRVRSAGDDIQMLVDAKSRERANESHEMLTRLVAAKIRATGAIPRRNALVDLAAEVEASDFLFEMKSTTDRNPRAQVRRAIAQLYEYRYLQKSPEAQLVVVIEHPLPAELNWMVDYVVRDRKLLIAWDGDGRTLHFPDSIRNQLRFLAWGAYNAELSSNSVAPTTACSGTYGNAPVAPCGACVETETLAQTRIRPYLSVTGLWCGGLFPAGRGTR